MRTSVSKGREPLPDANPGGEAVSSSAAPSAAKAIMNAQRTQLSAGQLVGCLLVGGFLIFLGFLILLCISILNTEILSIGGRIGIVFLVFLLGLKIIAILIWAVPSLLLQKEQKGQPPVG